MVVRLSKVYSLAQLELRHEPVRLAEGEEVLADYSLAQDVLSIHGVGDVWVHAAVLVDSHPGPGKVPHESPGAKLLHVDLVALVRAVVVVLDDGVDVRLGVHEVVRKLGGAGVRANLELAAVGAVVVVTLRKL